MSDQDKGICNQKEAENLLDGLDGVDKERPISLKGSKLPNSTPRVALAASQRERFHSEFQIEDIQERSLEHLEVPSGVY